MNDGGLLKRNGSEESQPKGREFHHGGKGMDAEKVNQGGSDTILRS